MPSRINEVYPVGPPRSNARATGDPIVGAGGWPGLLRDATGLTSREPIVTIDGEDACRCGSRLPAIDLTALLADA